jgi:hypothetical protein
MSKTMERVKKKLKDGWVRSWMMIEVLAVTEDAAKNALKKHTAKLEKENKTIVYNKGFHKITEVDNPTPNIPKAYSNVVELEMVTENLDKLVFIVMTYAPSSIEIFEPKHLKIDSGEAQSILNSISEMMHKFAAAGLGGVMIES